MAATRKCRQHDNSLSDFICYLLTPWCRVFPGQLTGLQLVKKFPAFHGTRRFITTLTSVRHLSLSWASPIHSTCPHPTSWRSILILSTHLRLGRFYLIISRKTKAYATYSGPVICAGYPPLHFSLCTNYTGNLTFLGLTPTTQVKRRVFLHLTGTSQDKDFKQNDLHYLFFQLRHSTCATHDRLLNSTMLQYINIQQITRIFNPII